MVLVATATGQAPVSTRAPGAEAMRKTCVSLLARSLPCSRPSSALASCLRSSVLVLIWADEATEQLCSHQPCPRGSHVRAAQSASLPMLGPAAVLPLWGGHLPVPRRRGWASQGALPGSFKHSQPRRFWLVRLLHPTPSVSHCPRALPPAWTTQASASSRQARSSLPDVSSLENQTIKGIAQRDKGRLFPQAWFLSGCWLHSQCSPA